MSRQIPAALISALLFLSVPIACRTTTRPASLPSFNVDLKETSVSGLSSGAHMAVQFEVAHSAMIKGAGIIAGGPYFCAQNDIVRAMSVCSCTNPLKPCSRSAGGTDVQRLVRVTRDNADAGEIDALSHLSTHRVFLFSGTLDNVVPQVVMDDLRSYYGNFVAATSIRYEKTIPAQHAIATGSYGNECDHLGEPFINDCGYDTAGAVLTHIYGKLKPRTEGRLAGAFIEFDQSEFIEDPKSHSMDESGWIYIPDACRRKEKCRIHVAFHGCLQGQATIGKQFIEHAGYNEWADANNIIVLYPQAVPKRFFGSPASLLTDRNNTNPRGCWNWWGYDNDEDYAVKSGRQITAVKAMLDRIAGAKPGSAAVPAALLRRKNKPVGYVGYGMLALGSKNPGGGGTGQQLSRRGRPRLRYATPGRRRSQVVDLTVREND